MSTLTAFLRLVMLSIILHSPLSVAGYHPLNEVPPLFQLTVFQSENDLNHYLVVGKDSKFGNTGTWYVLNVQDGKIESPKLKSDSFYYFGGGFDFRFESGEWLYIPAGNSSRGAPGAMLEVGRGGLIDPMRGREPLQEVPVDIQLLARLRISQLVSPEFIAQLNAKTAAAHPSKPIAPAESIALFIVTYEDKNDGEVERVRGFRNELVEGNDKAIDVYEDYGRDSTTLYIWAFESQASKILSFIQNDLKKEPNIKRQIGEVSSVATPLTDDDKFFAKEYTQRLDSALATIEALEISVSRLNPEQAENAAVQIASIIYAVEKNMELANRVQFALSRWDESQKAKDLIAQNFVNPIRRILERCYEILHKMQTPLARRVLLLNEGETAARVSFLNRFSGVGSETYFQTWLNLLRDRIQWIKTASEEDREGMRVTINSGGILSQFNFLGVDTKDHIRSEKKPPFGIGRSYNSFPLRIFGLEDNPTYRNDLVRFIIEMDKAAEYQRIVLRGEHDGKIAGSYTLLNVLNGLAHSALDRSIAVDTPGFSKARYYKQAMMVVTELLNTSRVTIINSATYLSILNTAVSLQKIVEAEFGTLPNAQPKNEELNELTEQLLLLHQAVQVRMVRAIFQDRRNCSEAFLPK